MVNPLILSTVVIAGVATAVTLEYTIFKPMREGQPILGHQFQEQWHGHFTRFRRKVRRACDPHGHFANGDDSDSDDEGRVEHGHKHDLREMHVRQSDGRAGANDHHGWRADPPPDELRLRRRQAHAVQPVTPDEAWRREMDADLIDFELHERQTRMVQNIARSGLEQAARGGDGGFATDTHRPGVWPQWSDAKPPSSTEHHDDEPNSDSLKQR
ncbi:hypothetical protein K437DRAFT_145078 [Tilletiaria anomala UBC 951]|uniref:Uncharacterized protein n=1 Tax=Tilletiaria anomala (strain ATCC 24038 / CBS 436.72 / UBC 951) TaxID=1037660 RepID=A0A066VQB5_TILAU|nr:uncharacterized protein K437DRAFT_145078 [Tilletiaria anomala UBC 951]KDN43912.1 hypothetical protein K437DRAFT_145078 [Tilletiaria anomala UBC 951]